LSLRFSLLFPWLIIFVPFVAFVVFFLLDDLLELFFGCWSSSCASCGLRFEIQTLCFCVINVLIKGEIEKPSGQYFYLICDE
jgi:hypothetical protein